MPLLSIYFVLYFLKMLILIGYQGYIMRIYD